MDKTDKLMYFIKDDTRDYSYCKLKLVVETFEHSTLLTNQSKCTKVPKVIEPTNRKALLMDFGD